MIFVKLMILLWVVFFYNQIFCKGKFITPGRDTYCTRQTPQINIRICIVVYQLLPCIN